MVYIYIFFLVLFSLSVGLFITSVSTTLGFNLFGLILSLIGIVLAFVNSNIVAKKYKLREQPYAGIISEDLYSENLNVSQSLPEDDSTNLAQKALQESRQEKTQRRMDDSKME